jgi:uncharacterized membrane protein
MRALIGRDAYEGRETTRIEAFSDGVIAIAITLLVLEVRVPHVEEGESLWDALRGLWPSYVGFGLSFVIIGIIWANHHEMFDFITRANRTLVLLNLLFLLCVGFLPFPTALLAEYLGREGERAAVNVYSGWMLVTALSYVVLWWYPRHAGLISPEANPRAVRAMVRSFRIGPPGYVLAFLLSFVSTWASLILLALLALAYIVPPSWLERGSDSTSAGPPDQ